MNQTNFFTRRFQLELAHGFKSVLLTLGCVLMLIVLGTTNSNAQTMSQVAETSSAHVISLILDEMETLSLEAKNPPGSVKTDYNPQVIEYYRSVIDVWQDGADLKDAINNVDFILRHSNHDAAVELHPNGQVNLLTGSDVLELRSYTLQLDLEDTDDSDLEAVFNFWRTVKNR